MRASIEGRGSADPTRTSVSEKDGLYNSGASVSAVGPDCQLLMLNSNSCSRFELTANDQYHPVALVPSICPAGDFVQIQNPVPLRSANRLRSHPGLALPLRPPIIR